MAAGIKPQDCAVSSAGDHIPKGVQWRAEAVAEIEPEGRKVVTASGRALSYDFLILAEKGRMLFQDRA